MAVLLLSCLGLASACRTAPTAEAPVTTPPAFETPAAQPAERVDETSGFKEAEPRTEVVEESPSSLAEKLNMQGILRRIHFDFDKYDLTAESVRTLGDNAVRMKEHSQFKVRIEGHCDERGTVEYNLALGEKRARAARDYLVSLGTPARGLGIISFGKERPMDPGHNEEAWALNRRAEFIFLAE
ncbi:MAG: peptidoglycan-associated lipoprotein Pal [Acidobacteria bacterium]|nr:peptidoglycan-associated lipoprotein Pal [Acidobacteriota bacterium]